MSRIKKMNIFLPFLISISVVVGIVIGYSLSGGSLSDSAFNISTQTLGEIEGLIQTKYVDNANLVSITDSSINWAVTGLDPYSSYIPPSKVNEFHAKILGNYQGIGLFFEWFNDTANVVSVVQNTAAYRANVQIGDKIIALDGNAFNKESYNTIVYNVIQKEVVYLTILRNDSIVNLPIHLQSIHIPSINAFYMINKNIGYIHLASFTTFTHREFITVMDSLIHLGMQQQLILDVRGNSGGNMASAIELADEFLSYGKLITYIEGAHLHRKSFVSTKIGQYQKYKLVIIVNEKTASAAEMFTAALQDWKRAIVIGRRTFGKGLVQENYNLINKGILRLTVARYYTPSGRCLQKKYKGESINEYKADINRRFKDGALANENKDQNESEYGGGGVVPDIFVPIDTNLFTPNISTLMSKKIIQHLAYLYYIDHKDVLRARKAITTINSINYDINFWRQLQRIICGDSCSISYFTPTDRLEIIKLFRKYLALQTWGTEVAYIITNQTDPNIAMAIKQF
ncbi:MAG: S41 family peptidase [Phycisphaerales bacterium]|nr:S41 family peptidase [Phycisphaerales bacterium]